MNDIIFCPECDYAVCKIDRDQARFDYQCPYCEKANISMFYSYGSMKHQWRWEDKGRLYRVRPFPYKSAEKP